MLLVERISHHRAVVDLAIIVDDFVPNLEGYISITSAVLDATFVHA